MRLVTLIPLEVWAFLALTAIAWFAFGFDGAIAMIALFAIVRLA